MKLMKGQEYTFDEVQLAVCGECGGDIAWYDWGTISLEGKASHALGVCVECQVKYCYLHPPKVRIY